MEGSLPYLWTMLTSCLVESSILSLLTTIFLLNFVMSKGKEAIEFAWGGPNKNSCVSIFILVCFVAILSSATDLLLRTTWCLIFKSYDAYNSYEYSSAMVLTSTLVLGIS